MIDMKNNMTQESGIKYICLVCKEALSDLDARVGYAVCGSCRKSFNPIQYKDSVVKASPPIVILVSDQQAFSRLARFHSWSR